MGASVPYKFWDVPRKKEEIEARLEMPYLQTRSRVWRGFRTRFDRRDPV